MRSILFCIALLVTVSISRAQTGTAIFNIGPNGDISVNDTMISKIGVDDLTFKEYQSSSPVTVGKTNYIVKTAFDEGEEKGGEAGFNVISVYRGDNKLLELKDYDMWTYTYDGESAINYKKDTDNRYFIPIELSQQTKALAFVGWPYGGDLPYLTIIVLTEKDVKLVFHRYMYISAITKLNNQYSMKTQTTLEEYDSCGKLCIAPTYTTIYSKNGILYLK